MKTTRSAKTTRYKATRKPSNPGKNDTQDTGAIEGAKSHTHNRDKLPKGHKRPPVKYNSSKRTPYK
jgi:hypothetical protein